MCVNLEYILYPKSCLQKNNQYNNKDNYKTFIESFIIVIASETLNLNLKCVIFSPKMFLYVYYVRNQFRISVK